MTTTEQPATRIGVTIDPWDPGYAPALSAGAAGELDESTAVLDLDLEMPAAQWAPITPPSSAAVPRTLLFADGVRRIDARVWVDDPARAAPDPGIAASYAAGLVRCEPGNGSAAMLAAVEVRRSVFTPSPRVGDLGTSAGPYTAWRAGGAAIEQLSLALQQRLTELEVSVATAYRAAAAAADGTGSGSGKVADDTDLLIVDGPLRGRTHLPRTVGCIKTHHAAYLTGAAATVIGDLRSGERTPVFMMGTSWRRHAWYLRLPTRSTAPWAGVVRCEAGAELPVEEVVGLADSTARFLPALAGVDYKDPRAPQNLIPIGGLEKLLRHRLGDAGLLYRALRVATARPALHNEP